jgi:hypothetical protein
MGGPIPARRGGAMARQRWGSFSVRAHLNTRALTTDVLLYDQLVFPAPPKRDHKAEKFWQDHGWDPEFLQSRLEQLRGLTRTHDWGLEQHAMFQERFPAMRARWELESMAKEARDELPYIATPMLIAENRASIVPRGTDADVVAAYQRRAAFKADFILKDLGARPERLGWLLSFLVHVPSKGNEDANLVAAIDIARNLEFQRKRRDLYAWQERVLEKAMGNKADLEEFLDLVETYNAEVRRHVKATRRRFAFTLGAGVLGIGAAAIGDAIGAGGAVVTLVDFATSDPGVPVESGPTAMFHHVDRVFGRP